MTSDQIRKMELWEKAFSETMLREIAAQLAEIQHMLQQALTPQMMKRPEPYVPHPDDKRHAKRGR